MTDQLLKQEFLLTNGIGGYASSSISFANTRKYHGLLISTKNAPTERYVLVHKVEERLKINDEYIDLSTNKFGEAVTPKGFSYLKSFERRPIATWIYEGEGWKIEKQLFMKQGSNTTYVLYKNLGEAEIELELHPLFLGRDYHSTMRENENDYFYIQNDNCLKIHPYHGSDPIFCSWNKGIFNENRSWYKNFQYDRSEYRGLDHSEDSYRIGWVTTTIPSGKSRYLAFSDDEAEATTKSIKKQKSKLKKKYKNGLGQVNNNRYLNDLLHSGDQFVVSRHSTSSKTVLAGYHWFTDWGRDTMIAMRGLTVSTGRKTDTESILSTFLEHLDTGMIPNRFPDYNGQEIEYNTIDGTLWLFIVLYEYLHKYGDVSFISPYMPKIESIIHHHIKGTRYNIKVHDDGLLYGGEEGWQLTWMDARIGDHVVTPRIGAPVEINALWYNALKIFAELKQKTDYSSTLPTEELTKKIESSFKAAFLNKHGYLNDYVSFDGSQNSDFRCNQIYAVSLPYSLLSKEVEKEIVLQVQEKLLTDYGIRSLDPADPQFVPIYFGDAWQRDTSYHQGTVWTFVLAEFLEAYLKVHSYSTESKVEVLRLLEPLKNHFYNKDCIHGISEIFDGLDPNEGRGCIHQAWSISGIIKLYFEYGLSELETAI